MEPSAQDSQDPTGAIWTIGHSNMSIERFLELLRAHEIELLVDVRTAPYSRHWPQFSRDALARDVWKESSRSVTLNNVIDVHMARLRRKLDPDGPLKWIQTVRSVSGERLK